MSLRNEEILRADLETSGQKEWTPFRLVFVVVAYRFKLMVQLERASWDEVGCFAGVCCGEKGLVGGYWWRNTLEILFQRVLVKYSLGHRPNRDGS